MTGKENNLIEQTGKGIFQFRRKITTDMPYRLFVANRNLTMGDSISYSVTAVPDKFPAIFAEQFEDSVNRKFLFFLGEASDDYGLSQVAFRYRHVSAEDS